MGYIKPHDVSPYISKKGNFMVKFPFKNENGDNDWMYVCLNEFVMKGWYLFERGLIKDSNGLLDLKRGKFEDEFKGWENERLIKIQEIIMGKEEAIKSKTGLKNIFDNPSFNRFQEHVREMQNQNNNNPIGFPDLEPQSPSRRMVTRRRLRSGGQSSNRISRALHFIDEGERPRGDCDCENCQRARRRLEEEENNNRPQSLGALFG